MRLHVSAEGPLAIDAAWERYAELSRWAEWAPQITGVSSAASRLAPGVAGRVLGPLGVPVPFVVTEVDHDRRRWTWRVPPGPVAFRLQHGLDATRRGTRAWLRISPPLVLAPVAATYLPLAKLALHRLVQPRD